MNSSIRTYFFFLLIGFTILYAPTSVQAQSKQALSSILQQIGKQYQVRFAYKSDLLKEVYAIPPSQSGKIPLAELLDALLGPLELTYKNTGGKYYSIVPTPSKKKPEKNPLSPAPIKKMDISGTVLDRTSKQPIHAATVRLVNLGLQTQTDPQGTFHFRNIPIGQQELQIQTLGYKTEQQVFQLDSLMPTPLMRILLAEESLYLNEVQVVAKEEAAAGSATSSTISRQAIDHLQATSLADVMQLLPGKLAGNPNLTTVNKISLRQVNTDNAGSLGTALIINGAPISNNANLQLNNSAAGGVGASYATTAGAGMDFRQIPADNIESVEVIRGIPSVAYGDLTSGAVIVKTRSGVEPLQVRTKINPTLTQFSVNQGFELGKNAGILHIDADYTYSVSDQRFSVQRYNRYTGNFQHSKSFGSTHPLHTQTGFSYSANIGQRKPDPDDPAETSNKAEDYYYRFYSNGTWEVQQKFARTIDYVLSVDYAHQLGYQQEIASGGFPMVYAMQNGLNTATLVPGSYFSQLWVDGKPFNAYAKLSNRFFAKTGEIHHQVMMGVEWRTDANFGKGKTFDYTRPPRLETGIGSRPRSYSSIPALNQLSAYIEDHAETQVWQRKLSIQAGLRYDNIQPTFFGSNFDQVLSPRINASYELFPRFSLRGGYGLAAKAPTLAYLYPQNAYFDQISLNHTPDNPAERLILVSTYVFPTENPDLKMTVNRKKEIGFVWTPGNRRLSVTAYHEHTNHAYDYQSTLDALHVINVPQYTVVERPVGQPPVVSAEPTSYKQYFVDYNMPTNGLDQVNKGIEFDLDFGKIESIRTSFLLNGAWLSSRSTQNTYYVLKRSRTSDEEWDRAGIYPSGRGKLDERFNTTLRAIHHIPEFGLVATLVAQTIWIDKNRYLGYEKNAIGYFSRSTGTVTWLSPSESAALDPEADKDITQQIADPYYVTESWKPLWLVNLKLTKELGQRLEFSFFANNVFMHQPLQASNRWTNQYTRRNPSLFFGIEFNMKLF